MDIAILLRFLNAFRRPHAGIDVIGLGSAAQQVQGHGGKFADATALQEKNFVVGRNRQQLAQIVLRLGRDRHEHLAAMAHLHHAHAGVAEIEQLSLRLFQYLIRQRGRPRRKIDRATDQLST